MIKCPHCQYPNPDGSTHCFSCRAVIAPMALPPQQPQPAPPPPPPPQAAAPARPPNQRVRFPALHAAVLILKVIGWMVAIVEVVGGTIWLVASLAAITRQSHSNSSALVFFLGVLGFIISIAIGALVLFLFYVSAEHIDLMLAIEENTGGRPRP